MRQFVSIRSLVRHTLIASAPGLALGLALVRSDGAAAAEAYLCDGGRVVYVEVRDLERLKRTDACIAGYYGITLGNGGKAEGGAARDERVPAARDTGAPVARAASTSVPSRAPSAPTTAPAAEKSQPTTPTQFSARRAAPGRSERGRADEARVETASPEGLAQLPVRTIAMTRAGPGAAPVAAPETDYRNVRVINAATTRDQWFHHGF